MKIIGIFFLVVILICIGACSTESETTPAVSSTTEITTSTEITSAGTSTRPFTEILAAANAEIAVVKIANQAYAAEHDGKYASSSSQLSKYLNGTPDAVYYFNTDTGAVTKAVNGSGITETFHWDNKTQMWQK